uniref:Uncharacterized protein n=1 Tax=Meloidogyne enterolobii TaxID=390850 RepID=A0A6V7W7Y7_MELEN|nr:unnamed protein product [Meloidogyne enterolobii]
MDIFLFKRSEYERRYTCENVTVGQVPLKQRQSLILGSITMIMFIFYHILYIPCILSLSKNLKSPCYKLLFYIGIVDIIGLWITGFETALFGLLGFVYCSSPVLMYISGCFACAVWGAETTAEAVLAFNRCLDMLLPRIAKLLFEGRRTLLWLLAITLYGFSWLFYATPALFTGIHFSWFFNPYVGGYKNTTENYVCVFDAFHNITMAIFLPVVYGGFLIAHFAYKRTRFSNTTISKTDIEIIIQVFIISLLNFGAATLFILMNHVQITEPYIIVTQFFWFHVHGFPPIIYIILNKTIRNDCKKFFLPKRVSNYINSQGQITTEFDTKGLGLDLALSGESVKLPPLQSRVAPVNF